MTSPAIPDAGEYEVSIQSPRAPRDRALPIYDNHGNVSENHPASILQEFLLKQPLFRWVEELKDRGWANPEGDVKFRKLRLRSDKADLEGLDVFYRQMQEIGAEMQYEARALSPQISPDDDVRVLDLGMAPGGYSTSALKLHNDAIIRGISLPREQGGHLLHLNPKQYPDGQVQCLFEDMTMFATEFGVDSIPEHHPEKSDFLTYRPFADLSFNLIFADGQTLHTHERLSYREQFEKRRLLMSQLIIALQRIEPGGTMVILLHKIEAWDTTFLLYQFSQFSEIWLFKQKIAHRFRSSFYLIAKKVKPKSTAALAAVRGWKEIWHRTTFGGPEGRGEAEPEVSKETVKKLVEEFGEKLVKLAKPIWTIQGDALRKSEISKGDKPSSLGAGFQAFLWREAAKKGNDGSQGIDEGIGNMSITEGCSSPTDNQQENSPSSTTRTQTDQTPFRMGRRFTNPKKEPDSLRIDGEPISGKSPLTGWRARSKAKEDQHKALEGETPVAGRRRGVTLDRKASPVKSAEPKSPSDVWASRANSQPKSPVDAWSPRANNQPKSPIDGWSPGTKVTGKASEQLEEGLVMGWRARTKAKDQEKEKENKSPAEQSPTEKKVVEQPKCSD
ncbi:MAG: hypothetical protein MMC33_002029 [Icmadophila ericetorum]|nr:hypothetical protein [Icmadophila ericetorum]